MYVGIYCDVYFLLFSVATFLYIVVVVVVVVVVVLLKNSNTWYLIKIIYGTIHRNRLKQS